MRSCNIPWLKVELEQARGKIRELQADLSRYRGRALSREAKGYKEAVEEYIAYYRSMGGRSGRPGAVKQVEAKQYHLKDWGERLGLQQLDANELADVEAAMLEMVKSDENPKGRSPKTVNNRVEALAALCSWAVKRRYLTANSLAGMQRLSSDPQDPHRALTEEEVEKLFQTVTDPAKRIAYWTALETGFRARELRLLTVDSLVRDKDGWALAMEAGKTKNRRAAEQPITDELGAVLQELCQGKKGGDSLFDMPVKTATWVNDEFEAAGITDNENGKATWHSFRKTFADRLKRAGVSWDERRKLLRHSTATMTIDVYTSDDRPAMRAAMAKTARPVEMWPKA